MNEGSMTTFCELFVSLIANGDDQYGLLGVESLKWSGPGILQVDAYSLSGSDGPRMDARSGSSAGRIGRYLVALVPRAGRKLRSSGVRGADEEDPPDAQDERLGQALEGCSAKPQVASSFVAVRRESLHEADIVEHLKVVRHEVRPQAQHLRQLGRRAIREHELVDDAEAIGIGESCVQPRPPSSVFHSSISVH